MGEETVLTVAQATTETPEPSVTLEPSVDPAAPTGVPDPADAAGEDAPTGEGTPTGEAAEDEGLIETIMDAVTDVVEDVTDVVEDVVPGGEGDTAGQPGGPETAESLVAPDDLGAADDHPAVAPELWLVLALVALVVIAFRPARRAIIDALDGRAGRIRDELEEAQRLREEAQAALANFQRQQRDALGEAGEIIAHAQAEADRLREHAVADLEQTLKRRESMAMDRITQAEAAAVAEVRGVAVDVAIAAARDVIGAQLEKSKSDALVDDAIKDLPNRLH